MKRSTGIACLEFRYHISNMAPLVPLLLALITPAKSRQIHHVPNAMQHRQSVLHGDSHG